LRVPDAVNAPRAHFEGGIVYHEPGIEPAGLLGPERKVVRFHEPNLFFGGVQAVQRCGAELIGAGDPRRGGVAVVA
jgi:gamma-glutamyltranspeptidase